MILIIFSMGFGLIKIPRLVLKERNLKRAFQKHLFDVVEYEDQKETIFFKMEKYISIISTLYDRETEKNENFPNKENFLEFIRKIKSNIPDNVWVSFSSRKSTGYEYKKSSYISKPLTEKKLIKLNYTIIKQVHRYQVSIMVFERAILMASYKRELLDAIDKGFKVLDSKINNYYEKPIIFKVFPSLGTF